MRAWSGCGRGLGAAAALLLALTVVPSPSTAAVDPETLATRIAQALKRVDEPHYETVAFSRIRQVGTQFNVEQLIDFANVKIVRNRQLKVVDRSKLQLVLQEQQVQLSEFVSAKKYQELGKLAGVDLFIYGSFYRDALVLKAIDTQTSAIAWAEVFPLEPNAPEAAILQRIAGGVVNSLRRDAERLREVEIRNVSFWDLETAMFAPQAVMDYLTVGITKEGNLQVVDRENLEQVAQEQKLSQAVFIDESTAKRLGQLYGVDAFIYGGITRRNDGDFVASLKMLNIYNGVIEWADLIKVGPEGEDSMQQAAQRRGEDADAPPGMAFIPSGDFLMGSNSGPKAVQPMHRVNLPGYYLDLTEVSNADYAEFIEARNYRAPVGWANRQFPAGQGNWPVVGVSWEDARLYCRWAGKRLPQEAEWEKAARGTSGQTYPWSGSTFSPSFAVTVESGRKRPAPVDRPGRDVSPYGLRHMAGNVREWVQDWFHPYGDGGSGSSGERVVRGGSWATAADSARAFHRGSSNPNLAWQDVGFRCAQSR